MVVILVYIPAKAVWHLLPEAAAAAAAVVELKRQVLFTSKTSQRNI